MTCAAPLRLRVCLSQPLHGNANLHPQSTAAPSMQLRQINLYIFIPSGHSRIRQRALTPLLVAKPKLALVVNTRIQLRRSLQLRRSKTAIPAALIIVNQPLKEFSVPSLQLSGLKLLIVSTEPAVWFFTCLPASRLRSAFIFFIITCCWRWRCILRIRRRLRRRCNYRFRS